MGAHDFLTALFDGATGAVRLCALRNRKSKLPRGEIARAYGIGAAEGFIAGYDRPEFECGLYFCTATLKPGATQRKKETCFQFTAIFGDIDDKNHTLIERATVLEMLDDCACPPSGVIDSGHGVQPYWLFTTPSTDAARVEILKRKLHRLIASDAVHDAPRVMRLPGTHNSKEGDWLEVIAVRWHPERRYTINQLEAWLNTEQIIIPAKEEAKPKNNERDRKPSGSSHSAADIEEVRDALRYISPEKREIWRDIGMALHAEFGDQGRALWDEWSATCKDKYDEADQEYTWLHFNSDRDNAIGIGTLFHHAQTKGWKGKNQQANPAADEFETETELLPELIINDSNPTTTARELAALIAKRDDILFNGYAPARIAVEADNLPRALEMTTEAVRVYAHKICRPVRLRAIKGEIKKIPSPLSTDIALLYLKGLEGEWGLKSFRGITTAPILKDDGSVHIASGLDRETGLWCHDIPEIDIPEQPTEAEARAALNRLRKFFRTFPFADSERTSNFGSEIQVTDFDKPIGLDESTFLVGLHTAVCRQSLELAPGILVRAICIIASGAKPSAFTSGHNTEEFDKRLTAALVEARPAAFLDNFNAKELKSDILASALTEYPAMVRPLGKTTMVPLHTRTFVAITGNAIDIAEDMARRILVVDLDARMEDPELRKFAPGFLDGVFDARPQLLTCALTIWRWGRQSRLTSGNPFGSFEKWALWCRDPLFALGCRDPIDRLAEIKANDPRRRALITLFDAWFACHGDALIRAADLADEVTSLMVTARRNGGPPSRQAVARFLDKHVRTRVGGYMLERIKAEHLTRPLSYYRLTKRQSAPA